jgi:hypothetical protein
MQPDHGSVWRYRSTVPPTLYDETLGRHPQYLPLFTQVRGKDKFFAVRRIKVPGSPSIWDPSRRPRLPPGAGGECVCNARDNDTLRAVATCYSPSFLVRTSVSGIYAHKKAISNEQGVRAGL